MPCSLEFFLFHFWLTPLDGLPVLSRNIQKTKQNCEGIDFSTFSIFYSQLQPYLMKWKPNVFWIFELFRHLSRTNSEFFHNNFHQFPSNQKMEFFFCHHSDMRHAFNYDSNGITQKVCFTNFMPCNHTSVYEKEKGEKLYSLKDQGMHTHVDSSILESKFSLQHWITSLFHRCFPFLLLLLPQFYHV